LLYGFSAAFLTRSAHSLTSIFLISASVRAAEAAVDEADGALVGPV
jgi:hypothetical protein